MPETLSRAFFEELMTRSPLPLSLLDRELRFVRVNEAAAQINGIAIEDHIGRTLGELIPSVDQEYGPLLHELMESGQPLLDHDIFGETPAAPGARRTWRVHWLPIQDGGRCRGIGAVFTERTELLAAELEHRRQALELNDDVMQRMSAALLAIELGQHEHAASFLREAVGATRSIITRLLEDHDGPLEPGDLVRRRSASDGLHDG